MLRSNVQNLQHKGQNLKSTVNKLSIDMGMSSVKSFCDGVKNISLVAIAEINIDTENAYDNVYTHNEITYEIGTEYSRSEAFETRDFETYMSLMPLFIFRELQKNRIVPDVNGKITIRRLVTGVPYTHRSKMDIIHNAIKPNGQHFTVNGIKVYIEEIVIGIQGMTAPAVVWGNKVPAGLITILEIGSKTVEILTIEKGSPKLDSKYTNSIDYGLNRAYLDIAVKKAEELGIVISEATASEMFKTKILEIGRDKYNVAVEVDLATEAYSRQLIRTLKSRFGNAFTNAKHIIVCGGGANSKILLNRLKEEFGIIITIDNPEFVNAKGYSLF